jgi:fumarate reductase flavoprotein subunit
VTVAAHARIRTLRTDLLILGAGGAGLFAALHAHAANPALDITIAVKGLLGKCGCTRMVQGGYNVALAPGDSVERHFMDTIEGGKWLPDQDLAWTLVTGAIERIHELENELGCFFDRNPDGTIHQKAFAGQTFDRTVHKGDLTGIEIMNRLAEQVWARGIGRLEEHRALDFVATAGNEGGLAGVLLVDIRNGEYLFVQAKAVLLAYRRRAHDVQVSHSVRRQELRRTRDGIALRAAAARHGDGAVPPDRTARGSPHADDGHGSGGGTARSRRLSSHRRRRAIHGPLRSSRRARDARHRLARDRHRNASRTHDAERRCLPEHGPPRCEQRAPAIQGDGRALRRLRLRSGGWPRRSRSHGALHDGRRRVCPRLHDGDLPGSSSPARILAACTARTGSAATGVANSTVFGGIAGDEIAAWIAKEGAWREPDAAALEEALVRAEAPLSGRRGDPMQLGSIRERLYDAMWDDAGIVRDGVRLARALQTLESLAGELSIVGVPDGERSFNLTWHDALNLANLIAVSRVIVHAATARENSRGAHYRSDFPDDGDLAASTFIRVRQRDGRLAAEAVPVRFTRVAPGGRLHAR